MDSLDAMRNDCCLPNTRRLSTLLVPALLYLTWTAFDQPLDENRVIQGVVGVVLGLYICAQPAANGIDLIFLERGSFRRIASAWNGIGWLALNMLVLVVGWAVIVVGTMHVTS